jgi:hypothetical protein
MSPFKAGAEQLDKKLASWATARGDNGGRPSSTKSSGSSHRGTVDESRKVPTGTPGRERSNNGAPCCPFAARGCSDITPEPNDEGGGVVDAPTNEADSLREGGAGRGKEAVADSTRIARSGYVARGRVSTLGT